MIDKITNIPTTTTTTDTGNERRSDGLYIVSQRIIENIPTVWDKEGLRKLLADFIDRCTTPTVLVILITDSAIAPCGRLPVTSHQTDGALYNVNSDCRPGPQARSYPESLLPGDGHIVHHG